MTAAGCGLFTERPGLARLSIAIGLLGLPLLVAWLMASSSLYPRVELWLQDASRRMLARDDRFDDAVVIEIDEASLAELKPYLGSWPYPRDVYALVLDYLAEKQVRTVFFDVLFLDERPGDALFRAALARNRNAILAASALREPVGDEGSATELERLSWGSRDGRPEAALPASDWAAVALPLPLLEGKGPLPQVGLISLNADADGVLRRIPLLHRSGVHYLPSAVLATLYPGEHPTLAVEEGGGLRVGDATWPVDDDGAIELIYPAKTHSVLTMPFGALAKAALGVAGSNADPALFRGKAVFFGSTDLFADRVMTPLGVMNGVHVLAIAYSALSHGLYLSAPRPVWNRLLVLLALLPVASMLGVGFLRHRTPSPISVLFWHGVVLAAIPALHVLLLTQRQSSWLAPPLVVVLISGALATALAQRAAARAVSSNLLDQANAARIQAAHQQQTVALVSHELKSPLATIDFVLQNLERVERLPLTVVARHEKIRRASRRLLAMINDNLTEDRLRRRGLKVSDEPLDLLSVIDGVVNGLEWPQLEVDRGGLKAVPVNGDDEMLRVVFSNLLDNAVKYSPAGTPICIAVSLESARVLVTVKDHGCGISEVDQARIFEPYYRAQGVRQQGTGLGLSLVREIVSLHGGEISVTSQLGAGTRFSVSLPRPGVKGEH